MKTLFQTAGLAVLSLLAIGSVAQASDLNGPWQGQGTAVDGECPAFDIVVSVHNQDVVGKVVLGETDFRIKGFITSEGKVHGDVTYLWYTIASLTGEVVNGHGNGSWRTVRGPKCVGRFEVVQTPNGTPFELAIDPKYEAISDIVLD